MWSEVCTVSWGTCDTVLQPHCISNKVMAQAFFSSCHNESCSFRLWVICYRPGNGPSCGLATLLSIPVGQGKGTSCKALGYVCRGFRYLFICDMSLLLACIVLVPSGCTLHNSLLVCLALLHIFLPTFVLYTFLQLPFLFLLWKNERKHSHQLECIADLLKPVARFSGGRLFVVKNMSLGDWTQDQRLLGDIALLSSLTGGL